MTISTKIFPVVASVIVVAAPALADSMTNSPTASLATALPSLSASVEGTGVPGLDGGRWFIWNSAPIYDGQPTLRVDRHANSGSGVSGGTYKAFWAYSSTNPANAGYEWTITGQQDNTANASTGAQNVAGAFYIFKQVPTNASPTTGASGSGSTTTVTFGGGATIPVGHSVLIAGVTPSGYNGTYKVTASAAGSVSFASTTTGAQTVAGTIVDVSVGSSWGANPSCEDKTAEADPIASCIGAEIDVTADSATTDANRQRVGLQIAGGGVSGTHIGRGILMGNNGGAMFDRGAEFDGSYTIGLDFTNGSFSITPIMLAGGQRIVFDGNTAGGYNRSIWWSTGGLTISTQNGNVAFIDDNGNFNSGGSVNPAYVNPSAGYKINGVAGFTGTKVAGSCTFYINGGIITNVTGC